MGHTKSHLPAVERLRGGAWIGGAVVVVAALAVRLVGLDHTPHMDELYHFMAGGSLLEDGSLRLSPDGGEYTRARLFTWLVAGSMRVFGEGLAQARLPSVLAGALLAGAVFVAVRSYADPLAAWIAAALVALAPTDLYLSQSARFYTVHALMVWTAAVAVFALASRPERWDRRAAAYAVGAVTALAVAYHLQISTALAAAAIGLAALPVAIYTLRAKLPTAPRWTWALAALVVVALASWVWLGGLGERFARAYSAPSAVVVGRDPSPRFYYDYFARLYGGAWSLLPLLAALALIRRPRFAAYLAVMAGAALLAVSFSAWRHERYVYFALPAAYALAAIGASTLIGWTHGALAALLERGKATRERRSLALGLTVVAVLGWAAFAAPSVDAVSYTYRMLTVDDGEWWLGGHYRGEADWELAADSGLAEEAERAAVIVATSPHKATYALGGLDFVLLGRAVDRRGGLAAEPTRDRQWNRPEVASAAAVQAIMACNPSGMIVAERREWRRPEGVSDAAADLIEATARSIALSPATRMVAYAWDAPARGATPPAGWACTADGGIARR
ncbi:MAG: glycosyltransferase family 39 protein [Gemmatimonadota bacterium]